MVTWMERIPATLGPLPLGGELIRTEAAGPPDALVALLGVYPAATRLARWKHEGREWNLPVDVERTSFAPSSRSGRDLDERYLEPLGLKRSSILLMDVWPYYLATTAGRRGRTMADNLRRYEAATGVKTAVEPRPPPDILLARARELPGNLARVANVLGSPSLRLLLTLGNEAAAFILGLKSAEDAQGLLYQKAVEVEFLHLRLRVVHLTHPGNLMRKRSKWQAAHTSWCSGVGRSLVAQVLGE
jgi:hypothetical protein